MSLPFLCFLAFLDCADLSGLQAPTVPACRRRRASLDGQPKAAVPTFECPSRLTLCPQALKLIVFSAYLRLLAGRAAILREGFLSRFLSIGRRIFLIAAFAGLLAVVCLARSQAPNQTESKTEDQAPPPARPQTQPQAPPQIQPKTPAQTQPQVAPQTPITLDTNETLFTVLTAMNSCGYDVDLNISDAQRLNVRAEVQRNLRNSEEAQASLTSMCDWYVAHKGRDPQHDLSQFVSLALYMQGPPHFLPRVKEDDMPPDAVPIAGFGALLERFYDKASLHSIWEAHRRELRGAGSALSRAAAEDGLRYGHLFEAAIRRIPWKDVHRPARFHGRSE